MLKNKKNESFLLVGHEGSHNKGCEALVRTAVDILRSEFPNSSITVASMYPEHDVALYDIKNIKVIHGISQIRDLNDSTKIINASMSLYNQFRQLILGFARFILPQGLILILRKRIKRSRPNTEEAFKQVQHLRQKMISSTAVISIGGDMFIDSWSEPPIYALESIEFAQFLGCKTIVFGASIWPFKTKWLQMRVKIMLEHCNLVTVRDDPTYNFLSSIGVESNVRKVSDGAFLMLPRHSEQTKVNWSSPEKKIVGFNGSPLFYSQLSHEEANKMLSSMIKFFTHIIDKQDCNIILVPHDAYPAPAEWHFLFEMKELINRPNNIYLPPLGLDAREMKALLGQSDVFIGMRFHSTIAALSQSIPTIGLSYSPKFTGLHKEVYGHVDFLIPYKDVTFKILCSKFKRIQENKTNIIQSLDKRIQILQKQALQNGAYIKTLLDQDA